MHSWAYMDVTVFLPIQQYGPVGNGKVRKTACGSGVHVDRHVLYDINDTMCKRDLQAQKSSLQECIEGSGHLVPFHPQFHSELNFIELF